MAIIGSVGPAQERSLRRRTTTPLTRRAALAVAAAALAQSGRGPTTAAPPLTTSRARLTISIGTAEPSTLDIGLYDELAPTSTGLFRGLCAGNLQGVDPGVSYSGSTASRIEKDRLLVLGKLSGGSAQYLDRSIDGTGYVRSELVNKADAYTNSEVGASSHDQKWQVSMRRGGGSFDFALTPRADPALDSDWTVMGAVLPDGWPLAEALNRVPARKPTATSVVYGAAAKAGGDVRARIEQEYRPLLKVQIVKCELLPP